MLPAYVRNHDQIKKDIDEGIYGKSEEASSERSCEQFHVNTLRRISPLGWGRSFGASWWDHCPALVCQEKCEGTTSFTEIVKSQGKVPSSQLISYRTIPNEQEVAKLGITPTRILSAWNGCVMLTKYRWSMIASIPEKFIKDFKKKKSPVIFPNCSNTHRIKQIPTRPFMRDWLRKKLLTI